MKYTILRADCASELAEAVNRKIKKGYTPIGGVSVIRYEWENERKGYTESELALFQAMVTAPPPAASDHPGPDGTGA